MLIVYLLIQYSYFTHPIWEHQVSWSLLKSKDDNLIPAWFRVGKFS